MLWRKWGAIQCLGICGTMTALEDGTTTDGQQVRKGGELVKLKTY